MAFRGQGRGGRTVMLGPRPAARGPPLIPSGPGPQYPNMVGQQMPGLRPGVPRSFPQGAPPHNVPRIPPPGLPRGISPGGPPPGMPRAFPPGTPGMPPGIPPPGMPPPPMQLVAHSGMPQRGMPPNFQQGILQSVSQVVQSNPQLGINMVARQQVFLPSNMHMVGMPPTPGQVPVQPPVPQQMHQGTQQTQATTAANQVHTSQCRDNVTMCAPAIHNDSQNNSKEMTSRHNRKETMDLDEGEIVDDEDYEENSYRGQSRHNNAPYPNERQNQRRNSHHNYDARQEDGRGYNHQQRADEHFPRREYNERRESHRRNRNWNERERSRGYEHEGYDRQADQDYYRSREQFGGSREDYREDYDRADGYDRGRDYDNHRPNADGRHRHFRDDRSGSYNSRERRRDCGRSPERLDFGMAAEHTGRRGSVDERYTEERNASRPYENEDRRNLDRAVSREGRQFNRGREHSEHRDRDNFGMAAEFSDRRGAGRSTDERKRRHSDDYSTMYNEREWDHTDRNRSDRDYDRFGNPQDVRRKDHYDDTRKSDNREGSFTGRDYHRNPSKDAPRRYRDGEHNRRDRNNRNSSPPRQRRKKEYFDSSEGVWKEENSSKSCADNLRSSSDANNITPVTNERKGSPNKQGSSQNRTNCDAENTTKADVKDSIPSADSTVPEQSGTENDVNKEIDVAVSSNTGGSQKVEIKNEAASTDLNKTSDTQPVNKDNARRSKSPHPKRNSISPIKPSRQEKGTRSPSAGSRLSPTLSSELSRSSRHPSCDKLIPRIENEDLGPEQKQSTSSGARPTVPSTSSNHRQTLRSPSSSRRRDSRNKSRSYRSPSHRSSRSQSSVSPRSQSTRSSYSRRSVNSEHTRPADKDTSGKGKDVRKAFSSEKGRSPKKAVAIVPPRKRSPVEEQNVTAKRSRIDRVLPTDQPIRDRDQDGRLLNEIPIADASRVEERPPRRPEKWNLDHGEEDDDDIEAELSTPVPAWTRSSPADLYFSRERTTGNMTSSKRMWELEEKFEEELFKKSAKMRASKPKYEKPARPMPVHHHHHHHHGGCHEHSESESSSSSDEDSEEENDRMSQWMEELMAKKQHPERLHDELWFNEEGEMNDGPLCRCSLKSRKTGIRHDIYPGEGKTPLCDPHSNNAGKLHHYRIAMSPSVNFLSKRPTIIKSDNHEFIFEGFSILSHYEIENVPVCKVIRFNIEYTIHWFEEDAPENIDVRSLDLFSDFLFEEILELKDFKAKLPIPDTCRHFHIMPRFSRKLKENGKEMLSMNEVLLYLLKSAKPIVDEADLQRLAEMDIPQWEDWVDNIRAMIIARPGMRPSSIRIDQLDREKLKADENKKTFPVIVHFGIRPAQLSYAGDPNYQKLWKQYVKLKHLLANKPKVNESDKRKLMAQEDQLQDMRMRSSMKREVTVELSAQDFVKTGIKSDVCQHAMLLPVLIGHLRFHKCLNALEDRIKYRFSDRMLIQLALTHPSYRVNFGTNPDHARNSLSNCGFRQPEYGDRRIHHVHNRKRGINTLINIMSRMGRKQETASEINHYERLEFLGDAVVEFLSSIHLFYMFPTLEEGGLATYRAAIVQNQHLSVLAKKLKLQEYMLYAHGPDLCHESDLKHAMANCLEALMGALFLDGGIDLADRVFGEVLFDDDERLLNTWINLPRHLLQEDEPNGDRHWISSSPVLQKLVKFEEETGIPFNHIRLLARSFTMRNVGYNNLTFGHNQRLEFLGDTVLQIVASEYLFKHFPEHHEGHLSLLRSSLVNNFTQAVVCDDLGMTNYIIHSDARLVDKDTMKHKEKADLLEAYIGALYVDRDLEYCQVFSEVCFFPRLKQFIMNQDWNDPKSQLQQCCLTLRELEGGEPDIPIYKMIASTGPTNTRKYTVAVYFRRKRLATGTGHSIQMAEMAAATNALRDKSGMFPQLDYQKKFVEKKYKFNKDNKLRRKRKGNSDRSPQADSSSNRNPEERTNARSPSRNSSKPRDNVKDSKTSEDRKPVHSPSRSSSQPSRHNTRNTMHTSPKTWRRGTPLGRGAFSHAFHRGRGGMMHRPGGRMGMYRRGMGRGSIYRGGPGDRGHVSRPTRSQRP